MSYDQQLADALREIERLKQNTPTPEEARRLVSDLYHDDECVGLDDFEKCNCSIRVIRDKLRRISEGEKTPDTTTNATTARETT